MNPAVYDMLYSAVRSALLHASEDNILEVVHEAIVAHKIEKD